MSRLNLEAFKAQTSEQETQELENLSGGILGACHCSTCDRELSYAEESGASHGWTWEHFWNSVTN